MLDGEEPLIADGSTKEDNSSTEIIVTFSQQDNQGTTNVDAPVVADLDLEEDDVDGEEFTGDGDILTSSSIPASKSLTSKTPDGVQQEYICLVQRRIQYELHRDFPSLQEKRWLKDHLVNNN